MTEQPISTQREVQPMGLDERIELALMCLNYDREAPWSAEEVRDLRAAYTVVFAAKDGKPTLEDVVGQCEGERLREALLRIDRKGKAGYEALKKTIEYRGW